MWARQDGANGVVEWTISSPSGGLPDGMQAEVHYDPADALPWTVRLNYLNHPSIGPDQVDQLLAAAP